MATNSQIAFNPQGKTVVVAADPTAPTGVQAPASTVNPRGRDPALPANAYFSGYSLSAATVYITPGEGI